MYNKNVQKTIIDQKECVQNMFQYLHVFYVFIIHKEITFGAITVLI